METFDIATGEIASHSHTTSSAGAHSHTLKVGGGSSSQSGYNGTSEGYPNGTAFNVNTSSAGTHTHTINNSGSDTPHNTLQPYSVVHLWRRTS